MPPEKTELAKHVVAIVGRQNVGKSTFLNRVAGRRIAIVEDLPGTTRDRIMVDVSWEGTDFVLVDTGGLEPTAGAAVARGVKRQVEAAIAEADLIVFLTSAADRVTPGDLDIAELLRRTNKPVILAANKADNDRLESQASEFYRLGFGDPVAISAYHGRGVAELLDRIIALLPAPSPAGIKQQMMKVAIVGRPNVGKSMLLNTLLGEERAIVDETPGTTRDAIDTPFDFGGQTVLLIDTAGIRRRGRLEAGVERYSVTRALEAIDRSDVALLVIDASEGMTAQDEHVAGYIHKALKGIVVIVNKWDLIKDNNTAEWDSYVRGRLKFVSYAPIVYTSAKTGQGVEDIMPQAQHVYEERLKRVPTTVVNGVVQQAVASRKPPAVGSQRIKVLYATQAAISPPTFVFFVNNTKIHFSYQRYLENRLRQSFGFEGTPIRMVFKARSEKDGNS